MKLHEITGNFLTDKDDIKEWLDKHGIVTNKQGVYGFAVIPNHPDGVYMFGSQQKVVLNKNTITQGKRNLPVKFSSATVKSLTLDGVRIRSLLGLPTKLTGDLIIKDCHLDNLEGLPEDLEGNLTIQDCTFSMKGVEKFMGKVTGKILIDHCDITEGGIGLVLCDGIDKTKFEVKGTNEQSLAFNIIIRHFIGDSDAIFDCQDELHLHDSLDKYAEL